MKFGSKVYLVMKTMLNLKKISFRIYQVIFFIFLYNYICLFIYTVKDGLCAQITLHNTI